ncbi:MAG: hypothetical protein GXO20_07630 [Thermodesulfobacteria bacterium]|nr:hypothetical protein [Thermodesulfobacteriota bacterium]
MREAIFLGVLGGIFFVYQLLSFLWQTFLPFDPFFPVLLGGLFWRLRPPVFWGAVVCCGLLLDLFSSKLAGPSVLSYLISLVIFLQFEKKLALQGFFPALVSLIATVTICETLRLLVFPALFEVALPEPAFYFVGKITLATLLWSFLCWSFCQISFVRHVFEISKASGSR